VVDTKYNTGKLYGLNCYTADPGLEPPLRTGMVQRVRLLEAVPEAGQAAASAGGVPRRLLGEAPVEADGSFHIEIPADTPVQLQAMDSNGLALATCDWIWVKQKENLGCIGCHEDPESIPENLFVSALARAATHLTLPAKVRRSVGFREHVLPVLRNKCATTDCHGGPETPLALALGSEQDAAKTYAALLERKGNASFIVPGRARASFLAWQVLGRDVSGVPRPATDTRKIHPMPPPGKAAPLTPDELRALLEWIDFGAQWETPTAPAGAAAGKSPK
jgi:hypothetical protein